MSDKTLKDYGWCQVLQRYDKYYIRYDEGGIVVRMVELNITYKEAKKAMNNQYEAENVIRHRQNGKPAAP